jgi:iron(II)-dependent oxidoreductase
VVGVNWYEALAYTRWLTEQLRQSGKLGTDEVVTLPSEAQWEKAARGTDGRMYPWGNEWDETKCNNRDLWLNQTTSIGIFPDGASPYGCLDMAGNVFEWTISLWGQWKGDEIERQFGYPYDSSDGRENLEAGDDFLRVLRGGSFYSSQLYARCTYRGRYYPSNRDWSRGFRFVAFPISPQPSAPQRS